MVVLRPFADNPIGVFRLRHQDQGSAFHHVFGELLGAVPGNIVAALVKLFTHVTVYARARKCRSSGAGENPVVGQTVFFGELACNNLCRRTARYVPCAHEDRFHRPLEPGSEPAPAHHARANFARRELKRRGMGCCAFYGTDGSCRMHRCLSRSRTEIRRLSCWLDALRIRILRILGGSGERVVCAITHFQGLVSGPRGLCAGVLVRRGTSSIITLSKFSSQLSLILLALLSFRLSLLVLLPGIGFFSARALSLFLSATASL